MTALLHDSYTEQLAFAAVGMAGSVPFYVIEGCGYSERERLPTRAALPHALRRRAKKFFDLFSLRSR